MRILIVNTSDIKGGAARAAYRLHSSLLLKNIDSSMLVIKKSSDDFKVIGPKTKVEKAVNLIKPTLDSIPVRFYKDKVPTLFSCSWLPSEKVIDQINEINPDVVHLHWVTGGMIRIEDLPKIKAPIVWSLHDNWLFTGGCHILWDCKKFLDSCGFCPTLNSTKENDLSRKIWKRKNKIFSQLENLTIVGVSNWINELSKSSSLLKGVPHTWIPNPVNTKMFKPFSKSKAKELWSLPNDKKLILFGANNATSDINKGYKKLKEALLRLTNKDIELVVFGSSKPKSSQHLGFKTHYMGHLHDDISLITLYNAVDVMVVPSLQEAFGQTASESISCGVPVVAFGHSGLLDIVDHKVNGYLAEPFCSIDLAKGINWVLENENYENLSISARNKAVNNFDYDVVSNKYIDLYEDLCTK